MDGNVSFLFTEIHTRVNADEAMDKKRKRKAFC